MDTEKTWQWPKTFNPWNRMSAPFRLAFVSACITGVLVHLYVFTNLLLNHDALGAIRTANDHLTSGRWALSFFSGISWLYEMPVVIGLITIFALAVSAILTVRILEITHPFCVVLVSAFLVSFPPVACIFSYLFTADAYLIALCLNAAGVYAAKRFRLGWLPAILCIGTACGIYQSFYCYAVGLCLFDCIVLLLSGQPVKESIRRGIRYLLVLAAAGIFYVVVLRLLLSAHGVELSSYRGMDQAFTTGIGTYLQCIPQAYKSFLRYFWFPPYVAFRIIPLAQRALIFAAAGCGIYLLSSQRQVGRWALAVLGALLVPLALNFIVVLTPFTNMSELMRYPFVLLFVLVIKLLEMTARKLADRQNKHWSAPLWIGVALCSVLLWNQFCVTNAAYLRLQLTQESSYALANRIVARIECVDGYAQGTPVMIVGRAQKELYGSRVSFSPIAGMSGTEEPTYVYPYAMPRLVGSLIGSKMTIATQEQQESIRESGILETMPSYPDQEAIQLYEGVIVVKLSD